MNAIANVVNALRGRGREPRPASKTEIELKQRAVKFDWKQTPIDWLPNEPFSSYFINEINLILPEGEFWFCRLYNKALPMITDEKLREDVRGFIKQEAMHARGHNTATDEYLAQRGINPERNRAVMKHLFNVILDDKPFGKTLPKWAEKQWLLARLGLIATIEHLTCVLGMYALENKEWDKLGADPVLLDLIRWHGAEEVEHRSVAFDLYQHLGGSYFSRYYMTLLVFPMIFGIWVDGAANLMSQDQRLAKHKPAFYKPWVWVNWFKESRRGLLPSPLWLAYRTLPYFSPWYDPSHEGSTELAAEYLTRSPAAKAATSVAAAAHGGKRHSAPQAVTMA
ncbi:metal-dependent hydrolase [Limnobacter humi]|uniref:Metal-dependent hydrolase n=1 Tax=Limnobacter humi TaxID=1778671 RepID=A0ABT1WGF8_9BURK|nr:metal-dependent hydrolase [Limnobacter humi]MCQ8895509.1 metal-dependent hydrolase [Limnobacter humi]